MKTNYLFLIILNTIILTACASQNQAQKEKQAQQAQVIKEMVESKTYTIDATYALPMQGKSIYLSYGYDLTVRNDSAIAYLPYYGVAYSAPYGGGEGGIKFKEPVQDYQCVPKGNSGEWDVKFKVNTTDYNYDVNITIYSNGSTNMYFNSNQRQAISFNGNVKIKD